MQMAVKKRTHSSTYLLLECVSISISVTIIPNFITANLKYIEIHLPKCILSTSRKIGHQTVRDKYEKHHFIRLGNTLWQNYEWVLYHWNNFYMMRTISLPPYYPHERLLRNNYCGFNFIPWWFHGCWNLWWE